MHDDDQAAQIAAFWAESRARAGVGRLPSYIVGSFWGVELPPPAWAFGDNPAMADELLALVLSGQKTATSSLPIEYEWDDEPTPQQGDLSIVLDGAGEPRALIRTTRVDRVPFDQVDAAYAALEGEGDRTLASWRADHERYWRRILEPRGHQFDPAMEVVCERFEVLFAQG